jgi:hypothetical protein
MNQVQSGLTEFDPLRCFLEFLYAAVTVQESSEATNLPLHHMNDSDSITGLESVRLVC